MNKKTLDKIRGQKSLVSRRYNVRIKEALESGKVASANSLRGAKTLKLREVESKILENI